MYTNNVSCLVLDEIAQLWSMAQYGSLCHNSKKPWTVCVLDSALNVALTRTLCIAIFFCYQPVSCALGILCRILLPWQSKLYHSNNFTHICLGFCWNFSCLLFSTLLSTNTFCFTLICINRDNRFILEEEHKINYPYILVSWSSGSWINDENNNLLVLINGPITNSSTGISKPLSFSGQLLQDSDFSKKCW